MQKELTLSSTAIMKYENSLVELAERFTIYLDVSALSVKNYKTGVKNFLAFLKEHGISQPSRADILEYKKDLLKKYSANTTALYLSAIRRFFSWLESERLYSNITDGVKSPRISKDHKRDCFSGDQIKKIITGMKRDTVQAKRDYAIFTLIASCGLRCCEVSRANVGDIHSVMGVTVLDIQGKGHSSKDAFVKLADPVVKAITEYLSARGTVKDDEPLFVSCSRRNKGQRLSTETISTACKKAMKAAGFDSKRLTAHSLRHSAITLCLIGGMSLDDVSEFARHSNVGVTMIYNHAVSRIKSACEATVASAIFAA